jgi:uncharacterized protein YgbK (DUF1537 family)
MTDMVLRIGCIADDFTGASDAASFLHENGLKTVLINGLPSANYSLQTKCDALVIALKSRTQQTASAVSDSLKACEYLMDRGVKLLYFKYCSTFDSTKEGNIGPVIDAIMERYGIKYTVICPAMLPNNRTVKDSLLYVGGVPLEETHMKHHPLTPMWSSDLIELIKPQGKYNSRAIKADIVGNKKLLDSFVKSAIFEAESREEEHFYFVPDYFTWQHGKNLADCFSNSLFLTGASGFLGDLAAHLDLVKDGKNCGPETVYSFKKGRLILAGSCSQATQEQVKYYISQNKPSLRIDPGSIENVDGEIVKCIEFVEKYGDQDILIYTSGSGGIRETKYFGSSGAHEYAEKIMSATAKEAIRLGIERLVVAGGETAGAVMVSLGFKSLLIGKSLAPGVPIMIPTDDRRINLVLKSGNFGDERFFISVLA